MGADDRLERLPASHNGAGRRAFLVVLVGLLVIGVCILMVTVRSQGPPGAATPLPTTTRSMSFAACQQTLRQTIQTMGVLPWDVVRIIDTDGYSVPRVCTSDGSILITCTGPDWKMAVTKSPYRDGCSA